MAQNNYQQNIALQLRSNAEQVANCNKYCKTKTFDNYS